MTTPRRRLTILAVMLGAAAAACTRAQEGREPASTASKRLTQIAAAYVESHYPDFDLTKYPPNVEDRGDSWEVGYRLPSGTLGGTPVVMIDKATLNVIGSFREQ